jgi:hypothetical protein
MEPESSNRDASQEKKEEWSEVPTDPGTNYARRKSLSLAVKFQAAVRAVCVCETG